MTSRARRWITVAGAVVLLTLAFGGPAAAIAQAVGPSTGVTGTVAVLPRGTQTFHPGRSAGISPNAPAPSPASFVGAAAVALGAIAVVTFVVLSLDRRSRTQLRVVEGSAEASGRREPDQTEDQKRKAA